MVRHNETLTTDYSLITGGSELLGRVGPLWLQLRQHHAQVSPHWSEQLLKVTFNQRRDGLIAKASSDMLVLLAVEDDQDIGYCISTIAAQGYGEIDSLFVSPNYRKMGIGHALMTQSLDWFREKNVTTITLDVMVGNEAAWPFYARYGFHPRTVELRRIDSR
jgi:ribosomal protein S18 acetylase RimI-like enzyme